MHARVSRDESPSSAEHARAPPPFKPFDAPPRKLTHTKPVGRLLGVDGPTSPVAVWCWRAGTAAGTRDALVLALQHLTIVQRANSLTRQTTYLKSDRLTPSLLDDI